MADVKDFTPREMEIMAKAWNCFVEEPKVDYKMLAEECGMTNPRSASNAWASIKKKIMAKGGASGTASPTKGGSEAGGSTPKPKATPRKRKAKEDGESPTKKTKGMKGKAGDADEDDAESPVKGEPQEEDGL